MELIRAELVDLPYSVHGLTVRSVDNEGIFYTIFINAHISVEEQCEAYDHEIRHINNNDFDSMYSLENIEYINRSRNEKNIHI